MKAVDGRRGGVGSPILLAVIVVIYLIDVAAAQPRMPSAGPLQQSAPQSSSRPKALQDIGIEQRLNEQVPLDLAFRDETGRELRLRELFGKKPVILAPVYYSCPMLCNQVLNGLESGLDGVKFTAGKEFDIVAVSFDSRETPEMARDKKDYYVKRYKREGAEAGWHFLVGGQESIDQLTRAVGFKYAWDDETSQFAHASGVMVLTPEGKLSRYFYGIDYAPRDLQFGLMDASQNKIGSIVDQVLLACYHYDPVTGKYGPIVMNSLRVGGILTILGMVALVLILKRRNAALRRADAGGTA